MRAAIFCGSSMGYPGDFAAAAADFGRSLARAGVGIVYGGASVGLMGVLADAALAAGGRVTGVMPSVLVAKEVAHNGLTDLRVVSSMHERKALMSDLSDGFIALPGGWGTWEEFFEVLTWSQLGLHQKPCGLLNVSGYFDGLLQFLDYAVAQQFINPMHRANILVEQHPARLVDQLERNFAGPNGEWLARKAQA